QKVTCFWNALITSCQIEECRGRWSQRAVNALLVYDRRLLVAHTGACIADSRCFSALPHRLEQRHRMKTIRASSWKELLEELYEESWQPSLGVFAPTTPSAA